MFGDNFGVIAFVVLIAAFVIYIVAAAMRDKKKRLSDDPEDGFEELGAPAAESALPAEGAAAYCMSCMAECGGTESFCSVCGKPLTLQAGPGCLP
ncbi:MAG: hypothetical protein IJK98_08840, partial [Clostridia bacterium]|nr:hypothetical protein [Clostridia bacterium]